MTRPRIIVVIPAYNPDDKLCPVVAALCRHVPVVLVDDGSEQEGRALIDRLPAEANLTVLRHDVNRGKGAALKTAFRHVLAHHPDAAGVVTVDADGQHVPEDALTVARRLEHGDGALIVGVRRFNADVPWRSAFGNRVTRLVMRLGCGITLSDTQTGLRGIPMVFLPAIVAIPFDRYELETEMLRALQQTGARFEEIPIRTVYYRGNVRSHFRPVLDSMRIYWVLLRHVLSGVLAAIVDFSVYLAAFSFSHHILLSVSLGRLSSLFVNFALVKLFAFRSHHRTARQFVLYLLQVGIMAVVAAQLVNVAWTSLAIAPEMSKIPVDILLYPVNFLIQKALVFTPSRR